MSSGPRGPRVTHPQISGFVNLTFESTLLWPLWMQELILRESQPLRLSNEGTYLPQGAAVRAKYL